MQSKKTIRNSIKRKFINPLNTGCNFNIKKLNNEKITKHSETVSLLTQANETLKNVDYNLKANKLVDAMILMRSSFEYIMMGMMIQFDEKVYDEFITLGIERDRTRVCVIIDKFRTHMNEICEEMYKDINRKEKLKMLTELYDKMCHFTHSSLIVSAMIEIKDTNEKEVFQLLIYQNYYFLKMLLFYCLKYFTSSQKHYLELRSVVFSFLFLFTEINEKIKKYKIDFSKYNDLLYYDKNIEYFKQDLKEIITLKNEGEKLSKVIKDNQDKFTEELIKFLK